jgi:hypothetical protein
MIRKKSRRGKTGSVTITETDFSSWANTVKAKTLSGIGSRNRVRSGLGQITGLRLFPSFGLDG